MSNGRVAGFDRLVWLRDRRRLFVAASLGALGLLLLLGPDYGALQNASGPEVFRDLLGQDRRRYVAASLADLVFAAVYGLGAFSLTVGTRRLPIVGATLVAAGAAFDELENVTLIRNITGSDELDQGAIDLMHAFGRAKYVLVVVGLLVLLAGYVREHWADVRSWAGGPVKLRYPAFVALLLATVPVASTRNPRLIGALLVALAWSASRLNACVREDRKGGGDNRSRHARARVLLATLQLVAAALILAVASRTDGLLSDFAYFLGLALVVMSLGSYISELRQVDYLTAKRAATVLVVASLLVAAATTTKPGSAIPLVVIGLLLGELATELLSARYLEARTTGGRFPGWIVAVAGVAVVVVGVALFVNSGADPEHVLPIVAVLAALVFFASADGDALVLVGIVALALIWARSPSETKLEREPVAGEPYFVVFGDSYISGEGATEFIEGTNEKVAEPEPGSPHTSECRRATTAWPFEVAEMAEAAGSDIIPQRVLFLACSGSVTENLHTERRLSVSPDGAEGQHGPAQLRLYEQEVARLGLRDQPPAFAIVSIGGNDAGFGDVGQTCVAPGNCAEVGEQFLRDPRRDRHDDDQVGSGPPGEGKPEALEWIGDDLDAAYGRLQRALGDTPIVAAAYPNPLTTSGRCRGVLLDDDERRFIRGFVPELNGILRAATERHGLHFMDTMEDALRMTGSQLCSTSAGRAGLNFFALNPTSGSLADSINPKNWLHNSLHPNAGGHEAMAKTAYTWLETNLETEPAGGDGAHVIAPMTRVLDGMPVTQCVPEDQPLCRVTGGVWVGGEVHDFFARSLFPLALLIAGLWLVLNPLLRWAEHREPSLTASYLLSRRGAQDGWEGAVRLVAWLWSRDKPWERTGPAAARSDGEAPNPGDSGRPA